jgi:two-component system, sensor histidine kinase
LIWIAVGLGLGLAVALLGRLAGAQRRERNRIAALLAGQTRVLEMIAVGKPLADVLTALSQLIEQQAADMLCSILLLDGDRLRHGAAPSLPAEYCAAVDGITIGPSVGSCGTAAYLRQPVVVSDVATDPLWTEFRHLALAAGLRACWSFPILTTDGRCLGTFAMYYREVHMPALRDWDVIEVATHLAGLAIERSRTASELVRWAARLEEESRLSGALAQAGHEMISSLSMPVLLDRVSQLTAELLDCDVADTVLHDTSDDLYWPRSSYGYPPAQTDSMRGLRLPAASFGSLLHALDLHGHVQARTARVEDPKALALLREYGVTHSLYVALRRGSDIIGFLSAGYRGRDAAFTPMQERLAIGIAQLASMALENARLVEELRHASQVKSEFVSTMSHELRTPLSVILGYADMLEDEGLDAGERARTVGRLRSAGLELLEMVEATLNLGRIEAGNDDARFEAVSLDELLAELAVEFAALTGRPSTALRWEPSADVVLDTDRRKLRIIVKNLVGNALKFTPSGEVVVRGERRGDRCALIVRDTGVGIPAERLPVIFEMFRQGDSSDTRSYGGVGLGLYIVQRLLDQLGGHIAVASAPGRGSTFTVTIPARATSAVSATA